VLCSVTHLRLAHCSLNSPAYYDNFVQPLRKMCIQYVRLGIVTKLSKLLQKGVDPNFQEEEFGGKTFQKIAFTNRIKVS